MFSIYILWKLKTCILSSYSLATLLHLEAIFLLIVTSVPARGGRGLMSDWEIENFYKVKIQSKLIRA